MKLPKTRLGKWSVGLIIIFFLLFVMGNLIVRLQGPKFLLSIPMFGAGATAILAFFTGIISIIKNKERSIPVFVATLIGLLVLWFVLGEILYPH